MYNSKPFDGDIEEVAIWSHTLSDGEINMLYNSSGPAAKLVQGWLFDE